MRFQVHSEYADIYLTMHYSIANGEELCYLSLDDENFSETIGEIVCKKGLFMELSEDEDVEAETI